MSQDDIVWVKVGWESLEKSQSDSVSLFHAPAGRSLKSKKKKENSEDASVVVPFQSLAILRIFRTVSDFIMCHRHWRHPGLDMRFVGQKDGEDQDPVNVQVTFEYLRVTFLLDLWVPHGAPCQVDTGRKGSGKSAPEPIRIGAIQAGALVETIPLRCVKRLPHPGHHVLTVWRDLLRDVM